MSSGTQVELDWAAIDAAQGREGAAGVGGARGTGANAPSEPGAYRSDEEILGIEPVGQASAYPPGDSVAADEHRLKPVPRTPGPDSAATTANSPGATNDTEDLHAFREIFPGGAGEALALREAVREVESLREAAQEVESLRQSAQELRQAAQAVDQIDAAIFSGDARAQSQVVVDLARANPAAFRQLFAEAARVLAGMDPASPNDFTASARNEASRPGGVRNPSLGAVDAHNQQRDSSSSRPFDIQASSQGKEAGTLRNDSAVGSHPPSPNGGYGGQANHGFDAAAYATFERGTNDVVARDVRAAIGDTLGRVLPDGIAEGAARRIGDDIFNEIHRTLAADRTLSEQVGDVLRAPLTAGQGWRFGAAEQRRVASLLAGRARQLVPGVARRVVGEWTSSVLGTARNKAARQAAAAARVDIAAPGGSLDSMSLAGNARGEALRPMAARGVDYGSMSDDEILSM